MLHQMRMKVTTIPRAVVSPASTSPPILMHRDHPLHEAAVPSMSGLLYDNQQVVGPTFDRVGLWLLTLRGMLPCWETNKLWIAAQRIALTLQLHRFTGRVKCHVICHHRSYWLHSHRI
eukprot:GGOE01019647.1.p1 GENE.GGOE01019647.1~~GGOE01019647.1.p1  ORF type:complete len:118 (+),score=0.74 GGOE01019647.1:72-425(+)